jgi:hypothetical protein
MCITHKCRAERKKKRSRVHFGGMEWSYIDQKILAPQVHVSTLPFRQLAYEYGATMVHADTRAHKQTHTHEAYGEEVIDER